MVCPQHCLSRLPTATYVRTLVTHRCTGWTEDKSSTTRAVTHGGPYPPLAACHGGAHTISSFNLRITHVWTLSISRLVRYKSTASRKRRITQPFLEQAVRSHSWLVSIFQASHSSNKHSQINTKSHQRVPSPYLALPNSSRSPSWPSNAICSRKSSSQRMREHIISRFLPSSRPNPHQIFQTTFCYHVGLHGLWDRVCSLYHTSTNTTLCVCIKASHNLSAQPTTIV